MRVSCPPASTVAAAGRYRQCRRTRPRAPSDGRAFSQRKGQRELAPDRGLGLHTDVSAVARGDLLAEEETEPRARDTDVFLRRQPAEAAEQHLHVLRRDADALIADAEERVVATTAGGDADLAAAGRVLHGVVKEVRDDGRDARAVAADDERLGGGVDDETVIEVESAKHLHLFLRHRDQVERLAEELEVLVLEPRRQDRKST